MRLITRLSQVQAGQGSQTASLFVLDGLANVTDFAFHFWMGRVLIPSDFAVLQTLNSVMLVYTTASGVFQPVVGRFVAQARSTDQHDLIRTIFQSFLWAAIWLGIILALLVFFFSRSIAQLINLPTWTIQISAALIFLSTLRPVAAGVLQGQEDFVRFGLARLGLSLGRIVMVFLLVQAGLGLTGAVLALPFGWLVSVLCAFLLLRRPLWKKVHADSSDILRAGWKLSFFALLAYLAYMLLTSLDLVWVNQHLSGDEAGAYSALVLLRRIVALLPGVAVTVMFPRIAATLALGQHPHRLLIRTASIIVAAGGCLTVLYFLFAEELLTFIFGPAYESAAPLLGWMGIATIGVSLSSIWLNYYLAEKPRTFVILLIIAVVAEWVLLALFSPSMQGAVAAFGITGWLLTLAGCCLYLLNLGRLSGPVNILAQGQDDA